MFDSLHSYFNLFGMCQDYLFSVGSRAYPVYIQISRPWCVGWQFTAFFQKTNHTFEAGLDQYVLRTLLLCSW